MATSSLQNSPASHRALFSNAASCHRQPQKGSCVPSQGGGNRESTPYLQQERTGRRQAVIAGTIAICISLSQVNTKAFAAESKKGFQAVLDQKDGYSFLYPSDWQEVVIQGQDKVFKDIIEPLESISVNMIETNRQDIRDLGSPQEVAEALIKKVLAPPSQKAKLVKASEVSSTL